MSMTDADLAAHLAEVAGKLLIQVREAEMFSAKALGKAGDATANQFLCHAIAEQRPDDGLLSEESKDTEERLAKDRVWIVDPVDGTREYGEARSAWAVHVGLAVDGMPVLGAVALPGLDQVLRTDQPRAVPPAPEVLRMVVSRTRPAKEATAVAEKLGAQLVPMGSAAMSRLAVAFTKQLTVAKRGSFSAYTTPDKLVRCEFIPPIPISSTSLPWATSSRGTRSAGCSVRATAARPGTRCSTSTTGPARSTS